MKRIPVNPAYPGLWFYETADGRKQYGRRVYNQTTGKEPSRIFPGCFDEAEAIQLWADENGAKSKRQARQRQTMRLVEVQTECFERIEKRLNRPQVSVQTSRQGRRKRGVGSEATLNLMRSDYRLYIAPYFRPSTYMHEIDAVDIEEWLDWMREQPGRKPETTLAEWTINGKLTTMRNLLNHAMRHGAMDVDVMRFVDPTVLPDQGPREDYDKRALRTEELLTLTEATTSGWERNLVTVLAFTGMRRAEICGLVWREVDQLGGLLKLTRSLAPLAKGEAPRRIALKNKWERPTLILDLTAEALFAQRDIEEAKGFGGEDDYVFTQSPNDSYLDRYTPGRPLHHDRVTRVVQEAGEAAGLGYIGPKTLRRTAGTIFANVPGIPDHKAAQYMGHTVEVFHQNYVVPYNDAQEHEKMRQELRLHGYGVKEAA
jgi:integrase